MSNRRIRITGPSLLTNAAVTRYTVAANQRLTIRHIHVENPSAAAVTFTMSIGADAAGTRIYDAYSIPAAAAGQPASVFDAYPFYVLEAAEILQALAGTTNILTLTVDGELELIS